MDNCLVLTLTFFGAFITNAVIFLFYFGPNNAEYLKSQQNMALNNEIKIFLRKIERD